MIARWAGSPTVWKPENASSSRIAARKLNTDTTVFLRTPDCAIYFHCCVSERLRSNTADAAGERRGDRCRSTRHEQHDGRRNEGQSGSSARRVRRSVSRCEKAGRLLPFRTGFFCFCFRRHAGPSGRGWRGRKRRDDSDRHQPPAPGPGAIHATDPIDQEYRPRSRPCSHRPSPTGVCSAVTSRRRGGPSGGRTAGGPRGGRL